MVVFFLSNLVVPETPASFDLGLGSLDWKISPLDGYEQRVQKLKKEHLYMATFEISNDNPDARNQEFLHDLRNLCLCFSYLSGSAVTLLSAGFRSDCKIVQIGDGFPRERPLSTTPLLCGSFVEFRNHLEIMMKNFGSVCKENHIDIIIHHWLDAMYSWSLEDFYLSGCTILEIIKWNQRRSKGDSNLSLQEALKSANVCHAKVSPGQDWINMRNDLIHEGKLSVNSFSGKSKQDCIKVACEVFDWIDQYLQSIFKLPQNSVSRFDYNDLRGMNSYTTWD